MTTTFHPASTFHPARTFHRRPATLGIPGDASAVRRDRMVAIGKVETPNYTLRRAVALVLAVVVIAASVVAATGLAGALADLGGRPAAASEVPAGGSTVVRHRAVHVAAAGDSLWSIAELRRGEVDRDRYVDALIALNGGTAIQAGQAVRLP